MFAMPAPSEDIPPVNICVPPPSLHLGAYELVTGAASLIDSNDFRHRGFFWMGFGGGGVGTGGCGVPQKHLLEKLHAASVQLTKVVYSQDS